MAEIHIEKKKQPIWPWIIGLLILVGIVWFVVEMNDNKDETATAEEVQYDTTEYETPSNTNEAGDADMGSDFENGFVGYVDSEIVKANLGEDHEVTGTALMKLSNSLRALSDNDQKYEEEISQVEHAGQQIQKDPESLNHADKVSEAFASAADVIKKIQADHYPDAESVTDEVSTAADQITKDQELLQQKPAIQNFFDKAADALEQMDAQSIDN